MITNIYKYRKEIGSKTKYILVAYYNVYKPLHYASSKNEYVIYLSERPDFIKSKLQNKPCFSLDSIKIKGSKVFHSGIYFENNQHTKGFGDFGNDLILLELIGDEMIVSICQGKKMYYGSLYHQFLSGSLTCNISNLPLIPIDDFKKAT